MDFCYLEQTPYQGGFFKIRLKLEQEFPSVPPKGFFLTKIFHPNVSEKGEICVNTLKKDWNPDMGIKHLLITIKCLLINPNPESALNEEAGRLLLENYDDYCKHAALMTNVHAKKYKFGTNDEEDESKSKENNRSASNKVVDGTKKATKVSSIKKTSSVVGKKKSLKRL